jgi:hypothetical protein
MYRSVIDPKLLVIRNDGSGSELMSEQQLAIYFATRMNALRPAAAKRVTSLYPSSRRYEIAKLVGLENSQAITYVTKMRRERDCLAGLSFIRGLELPAILPTLQERVAFATSPSMGLEVASYRGLLKHPPFDAAKRAAFEQDLEKYRQWKERFEERRQGFGLGLPPTPAEQAEEKRLQANILRHRQVSPKTATPDEIKQQATQEAKEAETRRILELKQAKEKEKAEAEAKAKAAELEAARRELAQGTTAAKAKALSHVQTPAQTQPQAPENVEEKKEEGPAVPPSSSGAPQGALRVGEGAQLGSIRSRGSDAMTGTISQFSTGGEFVANYFYTKKGMEVKYEPMSEEMLREKRLKKEKKKEAQRAQGGVESRPKESSEDPGAETHNPIVALEPEASGSKPRPEQKSLHGPTIQPSQYAQTMENMKKVEEKERDMAEKYHVIKTKEFTLVGTTRTQKPGVSVLARPKPQAEINEQYISIDAITDRRVKTMSMSTRGYLHAPPVQTIRKQGQHQMIARALNKKQTFEELMAETNSMINYALHDPKRRNFIVLPPFHIPHRYCRRWRGSGS